jgi:hypothetical protein
MLYGLLKNQTCSVDYKYFTHFITNHVLFPVKAGQAVSACPSLDFIRSVLSWLPEEKVHQLETNLPPKPALPLVQ